MATRSIIARKQGNRVKYIYCHWDGYPANNGALLNKHWTNPEKVDALLKLGSLSYLGMDIGEKVDFDTYKPNHDEAKQCLAYHRDRGEELVINKCSWTDFPNQDTIGAEWVYIYGDDNTWYYFRTNGLKTMLDKRAFELVSEWVKHYEKDLDDWDDEPPLPRPEDEMGYHPTGDEALAPDLR